MYVLKYVGIYKIVYVLNDNTGTDNGKKNIKVINCTKRNKPTHFCSCYFCTTL